MKTRVGPFIGASQFFKLQSEYYSKLYNLAEKLGYKEENILILKGDEKKLKQKFPEVYENMMSCGHNSDNRTPLEYAQDIVASWLFEDFLVAKVQKLGTQTNELYTLELAGADKERNLLSGSKVSAKSDCIFTYNNKEIPVEIVTDYTGFWSTSKKIDLRDNKYQSLCNEKSILLGISTKDAKYMLLDFNSPPNAVEEYNYIWHKNAYVINLSKENIQLKDFTVISVTNQLMDITNER